MSTLPKFDIQKLLDNMQTFVAILDLEGILIFVNNSPVLAAGLEQKDVLGKHFWDCYWFNYSDEIRDLIREDCEKALSGQITLREVLIQMRGELVWIDFSIHPVFDEHGNVIHIVPEGRVATKRKQAEDALHKLNQELEQQVDDSKNIIATATDSFITTNPAGIIQSVNTATEKMFGYTKNELIGNNIMMLMSSEAPPHHDQYLSQRKLTSTSNITVSELKAKHKDGHTIDIHLDLTELTLKGKTYLLNNIIKDITEPKAHRKALRESESRYRSLFENSADAALILMGEQFIDCNDAAVRLLGYDNKQEMINLHPSVLSPLVQTDGRESLEKANEMIATALDKGSHRFEWAHLCKNGTAIPVEVLLTSMRMDGKQILHVVWRDITELKNKQKELQYLAHYDSLTSLPNRILFSDRFKQAVAHSNRTKDMLAVCFLDLDNFKPINDNYGHEVGDKLLVEVANRITGTLRGEDTVSRQGGDEFAILLNDIESYEQCTQTIDRIHHTLAQPYLIDGSLHNITASSGVTLYPDDDGDIDTLLRHADQAMYQAKLVGKNRYHLFDSTTDQRTIDKHHQLDEITHALTHKEFQLYYQPKVNMKTGKVFGAEALIRWLHPEKGLIPPLDFLPILEGTDLELQIGGWVINEALQQLDSWQQQGIKLEVSINISSHHLQSPVFFDQLNDALDNHPNVNSQSVQLEILESSALGDIDAVSGIIQSCQDVLGVNIALDDFGTGYSSLTHMRRLSANTIKIDQSFVRDILDDPNDYNIIEGIIGLAKAFHREVIAEGVETEAQGLMLLIMGCDDAQGYGISRPLPAEDIPTWLADYSPNQYWLDYGNQSFTTQEHKVTLLQLTTKQWFNNVTNTIRTMADSGFGNYFMKCHLGVWLTRFEEKDEFSPTWLAELTQANDVMFTLAKEMVNQHHAGQIEPARARLDEFERSYTTVRAILEQYSQQEVATKA